MITSLDTLVFPVLLMKEQGFTSIAGTQLIERTIFAVRVYHEAQEHQMKNHTLEALKSAQRDPLFP
jgi:hypothetical protein